MAKLIMGMMNITLYLILPNMARRLKFTTAPATLNSTMLIHLWILWGINIIIGLIGILLFWLVKYLILFSTNDGSGENIGRQYGREVIAKWSLKKRVRFIILLGIAISLIPTYMLTRQELFNLHAKNHTYAILTGYQADGSHRHRMYYPKYTYYDNKNKIHNVIGNNGVLLTYYDPGDIIPIIYDPKDPYITIPNTWYEKWGNSSWLVFVAITFWYGAFKFFRKNIDKLFVKNRHKVKHSKHRSRLSS